MKKIIILCAIVFCSCSSLKNTNDFSLKKEINKDLVETFGNDSTIYLLKY